MSSLIVLIGAVFYIVSYFTYGKSLERNVVRADGSTPTPAIRLRDNVDYLPAHKFVLFGHHFASIAGAGPILGPAIAVFGDGFLHCSGFGSVTSLLEVSMTTFHLWRQFVMMVSQYSMSPVS